MFNPHQIIPISNYPVKHQKNPIPLDDLPDDIQDQLYGKLMVVGNLKLAEAMYSLGFTNPAGPFSTWADEEMTEFMFQVAENNPHLVRVMLELADIPAP